MAGKTVTWNGISSDSVPGLIVGQINRSAIGKPRTTIMEVAGRSGAYFFPQPRGTRVITAEMSVSTAPGTDHDDAMENFADWLDVEGEAHLKIGTAARHYIGVVRDAPDPAEWNGLSKFEVVWEVQPYSYDDSVSSEAWSGASGVNHVWDSGILIPVQPIIVITPTNGTLLAFSLDANGYTLSVSNIVVDSAEEITVNCIVPVVVYGPNDDTLLTGAFDPNDLAMAGVSGDFPWLIPGPTNQVQFTKVEGTATSFDIDVYYRRSYRR